MAPPLGATGCVDEGAFHGGEDDWTGLSKVDAKSLAVLLAVSGNLGYCTDSEGLTRFSEAAPAGTLSCREISSSAERLRNNGAVAGGWGVCWSGVKDVLSPLGVAGIVEFLGWPTFVAPAPPFAFDAALNMLFIEGVGAVAFVLGFSSTLAAWSQ